MSQLIYLDTETTGLFVEDRIIQLGYIVSNTNTKNNEVFNEFCLPDVAITIQAMEVHHITPNMLIGKLKCTDTKAYKNLLELNHKDNYVIIHNASFDLGMLSKEGFVNQLQVIDSQRCAKHLFPDEKSYRLQYLRYSMALYNEEQKEAKDLGVEIKAHDAIGDVLVMKLLTQALIRKVESDFPNDEPYQKLVELTNKLAFNIKPILFGKYRGKTLIEIAQSIFQNRNEHG